MDTVINRKDEKLIVRWMRALARVNGVDALEGVNGEYEELRELGNPALLNTDTLERVALAIKDGRYGRWYDAQALVCLGLIFGSDLAAKGQMELRLYERSTWLRNQVFNHCPLAHSLTMRERKLVRSSLLKDTRYANIWYYLRHITEHLGRAPTSYEEAHGIVRALFGTH